MEIQEKSFVVLQQEERLKKLERHLKLAKIKKLNNSPLPQSSSRLSISSISSISTDNPLLDFYYDNKSSFRAGSVVSSCVHLKEQLKNMNRGQSIDSNVSSIIEPKLDMRKVNEDRKMMPPPLPVTSNNKLKSLNSNARKEYEQNSTIAVDYMAKASHLSSCEHQQSHSSVNVHSDRKPNNECDTAVDQNILRGKSNKRSSRIFRNWIVKLNDRGQVIIRGKIESGEFVRSKAIKKRLDATTVISILNHKYQVMGDIYDVREELPEYVRSKFYNGFPTDWENVCQIWQSYITSGFRSSFRWPMPIADADDDIRSDITDLTIIHTMRTKTDLTSPPHQPVKKMSMSGANNDNCAKCTEITIKKDVVTRTPKTDNSVASKKTLTSQSNCKNSDEKIGVILENHSADRHIQSANTNVQSEVNSTNYGNMVPRWKIDVIIDNLMNKHCSKEYIDKVITAIDCFNELLTMSPTNIETIPHRGVPTNYNSNTQTNGTSNRLNEEVEKAKTLQQINCSKPHEIKHENQEVVSNNKSNFFIQASSDESEIESPLKKDTLIRKECVNARKHYIASYKSIESPRSRNPSFTSKDTPKSSDIEKNNQNDSSSPKLTTRRYNTRHPRYRNTQVTPSLARENIVEKQNQKNKTKRNNSFDSSDSDIERSVVNRKCSFSTNSSFIAPIPQSLLALSKKCASTEKINKFKNVSDAVYDSDISIVETCSTPTKNKVSNNEKNTDLIKHKCQMEKQYPSCHISNDENNIHSEVNHVESKRVGNSSSKKILKSSPKNSIVPCVVRLDQANIYQPNCDRNTNCASITYYRSSKLEKINDHRRNKVGEKIVSKGEESAYNSNIHYMASPSLHFDSSQQSMISPTFNTNTKKTATTSGTTRAAASNSYNNAYSEEIRPEISAHTGTNNGHITTDNKTFRRQTRSKKKLVEHHQSSSEDETDNKTFRRQTRSKKKLVELFQSSGEDEVPKKKKKAYH